MIVQIYEVGSAEEAALALLGIGHVARGSARGGF